MTRYHLKMRSGNEKTGPIPVSVSGADTCPDACPFKAGNGCYAEGGPMAIHWGKVSRGERGNAFYEFLDEVRAISAGSLWRHNAAGDLPGCGDEIAAIALAELTSANKGKRGFTYTHKPLTEANARAIAAANAGGFTVNLSANNLAHADTLVDANVGPVVAVVPATVDGAVTKTLATPAGRTVTVCPATYRDDVTCASCGLCQRAKRKTIVAFPAHGARKRKASAIAA